MKRMRKTQRRVRTRASSDTRRRLQGHSQVLLGTEMMVIEIQSLFRCSMPLPSATFIPNETSSKWSDLSLFHTHLCKY